MRRILLIVFVLIPGLAAVAICCYYLFHDWSALRRNWEAFETAASRGADLRALLVASSRQAAFRLNCFADGVGVLLGAILAAIGALGLPHSPERRKPGREDGGG